jgi:hypothetical protein
VRIKTRLETPQVRLVIPDHLLLSNELVSQVARPGGLMQNQTTERWRKLCNQASTEFDPNKLARLLKEIARLLEEKTPVVNKKKCYRWLCPTLAFWGV